MLADIANASDAHLGAWIRDASIALGVVALVIKLFVRKPAIEAEFVSKSEFLMVTNELKEHITDVRRRMDNEIRYITERLDDMKAEIMASGEHRSIKIHERLDTMTAMIARLDERTDHGP